MSTTREMSDPTDIPDRDSLQPGPTALRILVGAQLRRLRKSRKISREKAGYTIRGSHSKISRMEGGRCGFKLRDVADLLTLYGVADDTERQALLVLAEQANAPGWWQDYRDVIPDWFEAYLGLEQDAALIRTHEIQFVPGLLQTEDYARAVVAQGHKDEPAELIEHRVELRMRRQSILSEPATHKVWAILDEAALHRRVGGATVMRDQLRHLAERAELPHVTVQVVPFGSDSVAGGVGPVTILRFAQAELDDVVYLEHLAGAQYLTKDSEVRPYQHLMNELSVQAPPPSETPEILRQIMAAM
ncbi:MULTISPECIES: helix-turn-helix domain-containing protein [unclassified Nonomuraea]|uniref:helix-turn-helix domain-containing protein n=1 Tax=unclassified Nonomuraea TaxID=2593643 RepID=UPI0026D89A6D